MEVHSEGDPCGVGDVSLTKLRGAGKFWSDEYFYPIQLKVMSDLFTENN